ncbi:EF-hand domain-containing protein [Nonomuraea sp. NPDC050536]|uniref:EF-hand domain-containing protein n=1 Tax=Nonomuraea sp. NPDC050536 TaxID=3364366 RepID=UPI0037CA7C49
MAIDLLDHKLDRAFDHIDADGDGEIDREDVLGLGARILVGFGESPTSVAGSRIVDGFDGIWRSLAEALDRDGDSRFSREEFRAGMTWAFVSGDRYDRVFKPATEALAELADHDCDGLIGPREFRIMITAFGTAYDDVDEAFDRLDRTGRGALTTDELVLAAWQYYTLDDPHAIGNWLFGPL